MLLRTINVLKYKYKVLSLRRISAIGKQTSNATPMAKHLVDL